MTPREALRRFIEEQRYLPFAWGARDCCLTVADAVRAITGEDFAHDLRGYTTERGALRKLVKAGFNSVGDVLRARLTRVVRPRLGAVVMVSATAPLDQLFVADGAAACWGQAPDGLVRVAIPATASIWAP